MTFIQITTYGPLLTQKYKKDLSSLLAINEDDIHMCQLPEFDTEMDFVNEIRCVCNQGKPYVLINNFP